MTASSNVLLLQHAGADPGDAWTTLISDALGPQHRVRRFHYDGGLVDQFADVDVVIDHGGNGVAAMVDAATAVRLWQLTSVGVDHLDVRYIKSRGIQVAHCPGSTSAPALAECALMLMIAVARQFSVARERLMTGVFDAPMGTELNGRRLGLIGFGHSARALTPMARALGLRVSAISRSSISDTTAVDYDLERHFEPDRLDDLIAASDVLSLHVPLTDQTERLIDGRRLALLPPASMLINVSRGALVDENALLAALRDHRLAGAGIDAWSPEPPDPDSPLLRHPRVVATPHLAGVTMQTARRRAAVIAANVDRVAAGSEPLHLV